MSDAARRRRNQWLLAAVLVVLAAVVAYQVLSGAATRGVSSSNQGRRADQQQVGGPPPPEVRLGALEAGGGDEPAPERNPFRIQPRAPARPAQGSDDAARPAPVLQPMPAPTSAPTSAPIALKFIGVVESPGVGFVAALSDGTFVFHGREGEVIDGRYRIVKIGVESIVLEHVDGGGRQTIRLTG